MSQQFKPFHTHARYNGRGIEHQARLHRDLGLEMSKTVALLKSIGTLVVGIQSSDKSYQMLKEHETINERLQDIIDQWS